MDINNPHFNPGGIQDRYDSRDYLYEEVGGAVTPFDWSTGFDTQKELSNILGIPNFKLTIKDQNGSFSCGGQAWAYYAEVMEAVATKTYEPRSAKYIYAQTCVPNGGSRGRDNAEVFVNQGVAKESVITSYEGTLPPREPFMQKSSDITTTARQDAKLSKASAYAQIKTDIETVASAIKSNYGVILGVDGTNNGTWDSEFPKPPASTVWRHWVYAFGAKMINGKKYIGIVNSWGTGVGNLGEQWLGEEYFTSHIFSGWTHVFAPELPPSFSHEFKTPMQKGDNNSEVKALQDALRVSGEFPVNVGSTGFYGEITRNAVLNFQKRYKVAPITEILQLNGEYVGPKTRRQLNELFG